MPQVTINLLPGRPEGQRAPRLSFHLPRRIPKRVVITCLGVVILGVAAVLLIGVMQRRTLTRLQSEWDTLNVQRLTLTKLQAEQAQLETRHAVLGRLVEAQTLWSQHLNLLSDAVADGIWLTRLVLEPPATLMLEGTALEREGEGMQAISRMLTALQSNESFTSVFRQIKLQSVTTRTVGAIEVLDFVIVSGSS